MIETRYRWRFPEAHPVDAAHLAATRDRGISDRVSALLADRGVTGPAELDAFFAPPVDGPPRPGPPARRGRRRRPHAPGARRRRAGPRVRRLRRRRPDRARRCSSAPSARSASTPRRTSRSALAEGHGLSTRAIERAAAEGRTPHRHGRLRLEQPGRGRDRQGAPASTSSSRTTTTCRRARRAPLALVNPQRADAAYPDRRLAGSGVAFKRVALLLRRELGGDEHAALELAGPRDDRDRVGRRADRRREPGHRPARSRDPPRARRGPGSPRSSTRAGVRRETLDLETVAFQIAPRLNAAGRVGEAEDAARLLLADDPDEAAAAADGLEAANQLRRDLLRDSARRGACRPRGGSATGGPATLVHGPWAPGIVGLVASRLADERGRPAVVAAELDGILRASCRSAGGVDLAAALEQCSDLLIRHGGHRRRGRLRDRGGPLGRLLRALRRDRGRHDRRRSAARASDRPRDAVRGGRLRARLASSRRWTRPAPGTRRRSSASSG